MAFNPYLFFVGNCREAFTHYHGVLGGEVQIMGSDQAPEGEAPEGDFVMHAALMVNGDLLMGSDDPSATERTPINGVAVSYGAESVDEVNRVFAGLADGGEVTQEVIPTFFSPAFGMLVDRFGVPWMIMAPAEAADS